MKTTSAFDRKQEFAGRIEETNDIIGGSEGGKIERRCLETMEEQNKNRQIDKKPTKQVRIDSGIHRLLKSKVSGEGRSIKEVVEESLQDYLAIDLKK